MDDKRNDLRTALRELAGEDSAAFGQHCGLKRLIAYHEGTLPAAERELVQEHLSLCPRCTERLRELRDFEAAAAKGAAGPEPLRQAAWDSLVRRLPEKTPVVRPIASAAPREAPRRRIPWSLFAAAAALLLAVLGSWAVITVQQERQRVTRLEARLQEREASIAALRKSLTEAERQLAARGYVQDLEQARLTRQVAELSAALAELSAKPRPPQRRDQIANASPQVEVSLSPRFVLRGQEPARSDFLRAGGMVNAVRLPPGENRLALTLSLTDHSVYGEYRLELLDGQGRVLWTGRRPGRSLLGDAGTSMAVSRLRPGLYRLRIEGVSPDRGELLAEYVLDVEPTASRR